jgi:putative two-component system response regulator
MAKAVIIQGTGSHFDPMVVDAFQACEQEFVQIFERFKED